MSSTEALSPVILFEDAFLCVVAKPAGIPVQPDRSGDQSLLQLLQDHYGDLNIGLVHRLDRPVSGAMVFARDAETLAQLNALFKDRKVQKIYWAIVEGIVKEPRTLHHHLLHDPKTMQAKETSAKDPSGTDAELQLAPLAVGERYTLLEIKPVSGAFHQIRAQLGLFGHPVKGDVKYGARRGEKDRSIMLHARSLAFEHPVTAAQVHVEAPLPSGVLWRVLGGGQ